MPGSSPVICKGMELVTAVKVKLFNCHWSFTPRMTLVAGPKATSASASPTAGVTDGSNLPVSPFVAIAETR